ncbi:MULTISPECIES: hypothetical protein, partial [Streptomyces]|uniref:hypothetical protein n=1 Tax=Streptomyces TaxID=1883 RepID=UPI001B7FBAC5
DPPDQQHDITSSTSVIVAQGEQDHEDLGRGSGNDDIEAVPGDGRPCAAVAYVLRVRDPARAPTK